MYLNIHLLFAIIAQNFEDRIMTKTRQDYDALWHLDHILWKKADEEHIATSAKKYPQFTEVKEIFALTSQHFLKNRTHNKEEYQSLIKDYNQSIGLWYIFFKTYSPPLSLKKLAIISLMRSYIGLMECYYIRAKDAKVEEVYHQAQKDLSSLNLKGYSDLITFIHTSHTKKPCENIIHESPWKKLHTILTEEIKRSNYVDIVGIQYFNELLLDVFTIYQQAFENLSFTERLAIDIKTIILIGTLIDTYLTFIEHYKKKSDPLLITAYEHFKNQSHALMKSYESARIATRIVSKDITEGKEVYNQIYFIYKNFNPTNFKTANLRQEILKIENQALISNELSFSLRILSTLINIIHLANQKNLTSVQLLSTDTSLDYSDLVKERYIDISYMNIITVREQLIKNLLSVLQKPLNTATIAALKNFREIIEMVYEGEENEEIYSVIKKLLEVERTIHKKETHLVKEEKTIEKHLRTQALMLSKEKKPDAFIIEKQIYKNLILLNTLQKNITDESPQTIQRFIQFIEKNKQYLIDKYSIESFNKLLMQHKLALAKITPLEKQGPILKELATIQWPKSLKFFSIEIEILSLITHFNFASGHFKEAAIDCDKLLKLAPLPKDLLTKTNEIKAKLAAIFISLNEINKMEQELLGAPLQSNKDLTQQKSLAQNIIKEASFIIQYQPNPLRHSEWWLINKMHVVLFSAAYMEQDKKNYIDISNKLISKLNRNNLKGEMLFVAATRLMLSILGDWNPSWNYIINDAEALQKNKGNFTLSQQPFSLSYEIMTAGGYSNFSTIDTQLKVLQKIPSLITPSSIENAKKLMRLLFTGEDAFFNWDKTDKIFLDYIQQTENKIKEISVLLVCSSPFTSDEKKISQPSLTHSHFPQKITQFLREANALTLKNATRSIIDNLQQEEKNIKSLSKNLKSSTKAKLQKAYDNIAKIDSLFTQKQQKEQEMEAKKLNKEKQKEELTQRTIETNKTAITLLKEITELHDHLKEKKESVEKSLLSLKEKIISTHFDLKELLNSALKIQHADISSIKTAIQTIEHAKKMLQETEKLLNEFYTKKEEKSNTQEKFQEEKVLSDLLKYNNQEINTLRNELDHLTKNIENLVKDMSKEKLAQLNIYKNLLHILRLNFKSLIQNRDEILLKTKEFQSTLTAESEKLSAVIDKHSAKIRKYLNIIKKNNRLHGTQSQLKKNIEKEVKEEVYTSPFLQFFYQKLAPPSGKNELTIYERKKATRFSTEEDFILHFHQALYQKKIIALFRSSIIAELFIYHFKPTAKVLNHEISDNDILIPFINNKTAEKKVMQVAREFGFHLALGEINRYFLHYVLTRNLKDNKKRKYDLIFIRNKDYLSKNGSHVRGQFAYFQLPGEEKIDVPSLQGTVHKVIIKKEGSIVLLDQDNKFKNCVEKRTVERDLLNPEDKAAKDVFEQAIKDLLFAQDFNITNKGPHITQMLEDRTYLRDFFFRKLYNNDPALRISAFKEIIRLISTNQKNYFSTKYAKPLIEAFMFILVSSYCQYAFHSALRPLLDITAISERMTIFLQNFFKEDVCFSQEDLSIKFYFATQFLLENISHFSDNPYCVATIPPFSFIHPAWLFPRRFKAEMFLNKDLSPEQILKNIEEPYILMLTQQLKQNNASVVRHSLFQPRVLTIAPPKTSATLTLTSR